MKLQESFFTSIYIVPNWHDGTIMIAKYPHQSENCFVLHCIFLLTKEQMYALIEPAFLLKSLAIWTTKDGGLKVTITWKNRKHFVAASVYKRCFVQRLQIELLHLSHFISQLCGHTTASISEHWIHMHYICGCIYYLAQAPRTSLTLYNKLV